MSAPRMLEYFRGSMAGLQALLCQTSFAFCTSRCAPHDSEPVWFAIPFLLVTLPVSLCRFSRPTPLYSLPISGALTTDFPAVVEAVRRFATDTVLIDGEIVAIDKRGCPSFQMLQHRASLGRDWQIVYYAFDLLELEGEDLKGRPLSERKNDCSKSSLDQRSVTMQSCPARQTQSCGPSKRPD